MQPTVNRISRILIGVLALCMALPSAAAEDPAKVRYFSDGLEFDILQDNQGLTLSVNGPIKYATSRFFERGERVKFGVRDDEGRILKDGSYTFELRLLARLDESIIKELKRARETGDMSVVNELCDEGLIPLEASTLIGYFTVFQGKILDPEQEEKRLSAGLETEATAATDGLPPLNGPLVGDASAGSGSGLENINAADFVILDDLIVDGSACIGFDCVNGEDFGFDTIRLKENNLRIKFLDTSGGNFPSNDWQLTANASAAGGANKFSIDDISGSRTPFTLEAWAPSHSLYVDDGGRVGFGTSTPVTDLHAKDGDSPTLRLEQDGSSGFAPQTWDVAGNETNFFVRDVTNGSQLPFRIRPGADTNSIFIDTDNDVGLGTASPDAALHVRGTDGNTQLLVDEASGTEQARLMARLRNNGRILWTMEDTSANGTTWRFRSVEGQFNFDSDLGAGNEFVLDSSGNLTILGMLTENSNREAKTNIEAVDPQEVLEKVARLPIATWTYKKEQDVAHLGPMAQDFHAAFGLGATNIGITNYDTAGVALASIKALYQQVEEQRETMERKDAEIQQLKAEKASEIEELKRFNADLLRRLEALEQQR